MVTLVVVFICLHWFITTTTIKQTWAMSHEYDQYIRLHDGTFWTLSDLPIQPCYGEFGLIRSRRVVNGMRAVSILITELLIKTPWYTDQRSMLPSWQEHSTSSPFPWIRKETDHFDSFVLFRNTKCQMWIP